VGIAPALTSRFRTALGAMPTLSARAVSISSADRVGKIATEAI
jgi:hypothetical protein